METPTDMEIVRRVQAGDAEAFGELVNRYSGRIYALALAMVRDAQRAEDVTQEAFIRAYEHLDGFRGASAFGTWLYRIALNECLTFLNKQRANNQLSIDEADAEMVNKLEGDSYFSGDETQRLFQKALHTLPDKQRIVFNLKYFQEMKYEEISEILGTSVGALKASYHHAVKKIESFLKECF